jgi:hypothetical protein
VLNASEPGENHMDEKLSQLEEELEALRERLR